MPQQISKQSAMRSKPVSDSQQGTGIVDKVVPGLTFRARPGVRVIEAIGAVGGAVGHQCSVCAG